MSAAHQITVAPGKTLWHIKVDIAYEGAENGSGGDGVHKVLLALMPLVENGSGIKQVRISKLPERN